MPLRILCLLIFISIIPFSLLFGQKADNKDFIITNSSDTIYGQIDDLKNLNNIESIRFQTSSSITEFFPEQIVGFGYLNDRFFRSNKYTGVFLEQIVYGPINLYRSGDAFVAHKQKDTILLKSEPKKVEVDGRSVIKNDVRWKGRISYLIGDCLSNPNELAADLDFEERSITKVLMRYNKCTGYEYNQFDTERDWTKIDVGIILGVTNSNLQIQDELGLFEYLSESYNATFPRVGFTFAISSPKVSERVAFQTEVNYSRSTYIGIKNLAMSPNFHDSKIELATLSLPFSIRYSTPEKKYGFFFLAGVNYDFRTSKNLEVYNESIDGDEVFTLIQRNPIEINESSFGFLGGVGLSKSTRNLGARLSLRYLYMPELMQTFNMTANDHQFSLNLEIYRK